MRKVILIFSILLLTSQMTFAQNGQDVTLTVEIDDNHPNSNGGFKSDPQIPSVGINDHVLYFSGSHDAYTLTLTDENENVVYVTNVSASDTQVVLPASLIGVFKLRLYTGIYCFVGEITL